MLNLMHQIIGGLICENLFVSESYFMIRTIHEFYGLICERLL